MANKVLYAIIVEDPKDKNMERAMETEGHLGTTLGITELCRGYRVMLSNHMENRTM